MGEHRLLVWVSEPCTALKVAALIYFFSAAVFANSYYVLNISECYFTIASITHCLHLAMFMATIHNRLTFRASLKLSE